MTHWVTDTGSNASMTGGKPCDVMVVGLQLTLNYQCSVVHKRELWLSENSAEDIKCTTSITVGIDG